MSVSSLYQNNGYLMSQIEPAETIIGPDSIDIEVKVFEGKQFQINEVGITGNQRVDDEVIRRELRTFPGELYDRSLLMQTIRTLGSMGHFNPETIMPDIKPVSDRLVNVNWPQAVLRLHYTEAQMQECITMEDANEGEKE